MKKSLVFLASAGLLLVGCGSQTTVSDHPSESGTEDVISSFSFAKSLYEINSGDKVTVSQNVTSVKYSFQGGTPDGVTLNEDTGEITFDAYGETIPEKVYIATYGDKTASTKIKFIMKEEVPVLTFLNPSPYLLDGDSVNCEAKTEKGRTFAVSYSLKTEVEGITLNAETGKVSFSSSLEDGTSFTVVAESKGVEKEMTFYAMTKNIITATNEVIVEKGKSEDAYFTLDFSGNEDAAAEDVRFLVDDKVTDVEGFSYNAETKTVKIPASYIATLSSGEHNFKVTTKKNAVPLSLAIADKIIYEAKDFDEIFQANYPQEGVPSFKEGSLSGYYALGCDIDLGDYIKENGWKPIGAYCEADTAEDSYDIPFSGVFNGNGYELKNFSYQKVTAVHGLFGRVSGTVKNLKLSGSIDNVLSWSGGLVGNNKGTIENIILDLSLINEGQNATGVICSTNHGYIQNVLSLNEHVKGNINPDSTWKQSGILVGLNETDGTVKNVYGIGAEGEKLIGYSNNSEITSENCGKMFASLEEMKAYDFDSLPSRNFYVEKDALPTLRTLSVSHTPGVFTFDALPDYGMKGSELKLSTIIRPLERQEEYNEKVVYAIDGEAYGAKIEKNTLSLMDINVPEAGAVLTIKATLVLEEYQVNLSTTASIKLYNSIGGLTITNTEETIHAGDSLAIKVGTTPASEVSATFTASSEVSHDNVYYSMKGNVLSIREDAPEGLVVTVTASAIGETATKNFTVNKLHTFVGNNLVHYKEEADTDFTYQIEDLSGVESVLFDGTALDTSSYSFKDHVFTLKASAISDTGTQHSIKIYSTDKKAYQAYATKDDSEKVTMDWLVNSFGRDGITTISSATEFMSYFPVDGEAHTDMAGDFARGKVYVLTSDLDFTGVDFHTVGRGILGKDSNGDPINQILSADFYGLGHTIKNITYHTESGVWGGGFFFQIGAEGQNTRFQDITFENFSFKTGGGQFDGSLCGYMGDSAIVKNISFYDSEMVIGENTPSKNGGLYIAGLVGRLWVATPFYSVYNGYNINLYCK